MGPLYTAGSGKANRKEPTYLLVMVDPLSNRIWLEPIYSKHAEQVCDGFARRILLEWRVGDASWLAQNHYSRVYSLLPPRHKVTAVARWHHEWFGKSSGGLHGGCKQPIKDSAY